MERVTYQLERSLPSLDLLAKSGVFTRDELRAITSQRQQHEANLVRRVALWDDFRAYLDFEERTEKLRQLRCRALDLPKAVLTQFQSAATAHTISIYERATRKFKADVSVWAAYARWARARKMRAVLSRVMGRALAMHPHAPQLWAAAADAELNDNAAPEAARALLQRALRINRPPKLRAEQDLAPATAKRAAPDDAGRPSKKSRLEAGASSSSSSAAGPSAQAAAAASLFLPAGSSERAYVALALEYVRAELVFMERLRRRWAVLGIDAEGGAKGAEERLKQAAAVDENGGGADDAIDEDGAEDEGEDEDAQRLALKAAREAAEAGSDAGSDAEADGGDAGPSGSSAPQADTSTSAAAKVLEASRASAAAQLPVLQGAIIRLAVRSALADLPLRSARLAFVAAAAKLLAAFPFADGHNRPGSGRMLRAQLMQDLAAQLGGSGAEGEDAENPERAGDADDAHCAFLREAIASLVANAPLWTSPEELAEEMESGALLKQASVLRILSDPDTDAESADAPPLTQLERVLVPTAHPAETQRKLVELAMDDVLARLLEDDEQLPADLLGAFKGFAAFAQRSEAQRARLPQAARLAELQLLFLRSLRAALHDAADGAEHEPEPDAGLLALVDSLAKQVYAAARKGKYATYAVAESHFAALADAAGPSAEPAALREQLRKAIKSCAHTAERLGLPASGGDAAAGLWTLYLDASERHWLAQPDAEAGADSDSPHAVLDELLREHFDALAAAPEASALWQRAAGLIARELSRRDKKADKWVWASFDALADKSRRSVQAATQAEARAARQQVHDALLAAIVDAAAGLEGVRSHKTAAHAADAARAIVIKDSVASAGFWLQLCESQAQRYRSLKKAAAAQADGADSAKRLAKEAARVEQLFSKLLLVSGTAEDPAIFIEARIAWLRHLLKDREDVPKAMLAFDTAVRDAKATLGIKLAARIEQAWKEISEAKSPDEDASDSEEASDED